MNPHPTENGGTAQNPQNPQTPQTAQSPQSPRSDAGRPRGTEGLPVYESLVRERGDVVAEVREVAERTEFELRQVPAFRPGTRPAPAPPVMSRTG
ncbi:hypothetical protein [Streptomyces sp. NPDC050388]|uniref:hypothetical protein n=1 Tax=Streptomyces sp. NPDC050388 TaxID=3155781 RepID=UPI0034250AFA